MCANADGRQKPGGTERNEGLISQSISGIFDDVHTLNQLGVSSLRSANFDVAARCFQRVMQLSPENPEAHTNLGIAYFELGYLELALACHRRAVELNPKLAG